MSFFRKADIVNVKMVITEEKILSNIDKVQKLINPNSKKQIVQLDEDSYFKDLVESIKTYLIEYPKKKNFPKSIYTASYELVEYATNQFEENTKKIEDLIRQREKNIKLASVLRDATTAVKAKAKNWKEIVKKLETKYPADVAEALSIIGKSKDAEEYEAALKLIEAKINNLESNLHIEIDMERIEDRSKALSFIGIEIAEALKYIPAPIDELTSSVEDQIEEIETVKIEPKVEKVESKSEDLIEDISLDDIDEADLLEALEEAEENKDEELELTEALEEAIIQEAVEKEVKDEEAYFEETRFETKPSLWQRFKNSKFMRTIKCIMSIRIVIDYPALPEGRDEH